MQSTSNSRCRYPLVTIAATRTVKESARTHSLAIRFRCAHRCTGLYISIHTHAYTHTTGRASRLDLGTCTTTLRPNGFSTNTCVSCSGISFQIRRSHRARSKTMRYANETDTCTLRCSLGGAAVRLIQRHILGRPHKFKMYSCPAHTHTRSRTLLSHTGRHTRSCATTR